MPALTRRLSAPRAAVVACTASALALLVACGGSAVDPEQAIAANRAVSGLGAAGPAGEGTAAGSDRLGDPDVLTPGRTDDPADPASTLAPGTANAPDTSGPKSSAGTSTDTGGEKPTPVKAASCAGFTNTTGITDETITIGNSVDLGGPIPGLFAASQQAVRAYVAYFNATSSICGRKLALAAYDSRTDAGADQAAYTKMCDEVFAGVGSMSGFDSGGAAAAQACGLPDIRTAATTAARNECSTCFGAQALGAREFTNIGKAYVKLFPGAAQKAAMLYLNAGAAAENARTVVTINERAGMKYLYQAPIDVADFNYGPYVQQMKGKGVELVQFIGATPQTVRLANAMQQAGFKPRFFIPDAPVYGDEYVDQGGSAVDGTIVYINFAPFEDPVPEQTLYLRWLQQVAPGAKPTFFGIYAWSAAKLFVEQALHLGGRLTRPALVARLRGVTAWTGGGLHSPMQVGPKHPPSCIRFMQLRGSRWVSYQGSRYVCYGYARG